MAKVGFWLQGATGKLAGSKLQKGVNGTIIANNMNKPKNPRTVNQVIQRVFMNTVSQAYSEMKALCSHSFQGVTEGAKSMGRFQALNLDYFRKRAAEVGEEQLSAFINFVPVGQKGIRPAAFILSEGKLPRVSCSINASFEAVMPLAANTYQGVIDKYDLQRGDQLTFVVIEENTEFAGTYAAKYARIILDPRESDGTQAPLSTALIDGSAINKPNSKNDGNFGLLEYNNGMVFNMRANAKVCAVGIIVSREEEDEWKRSNCQMIVSEAAIGTQGISLSRACRLSIEGNKIVVSDGNNYLDNAGVSGTQSTDSGSGSSQEEQEAQGPDFNNTIAFTANGTTANQDVSGGSINVAAPLTKLYIYGSNNLTVDNVEVTNPVGTAIGTKEIEASSGAIVWTAPEGGIPDHDVVYVKKVIDGVATAWFSVNVQAAGSDQYGDQG